MKFNITNTLLWVLVSGTLAASSPTTFSAEFFAYHLTKAVEEIDDEDIFNLIQENVNNLKYADASNHAMQELINLIEEGYVIDPFNMSKLIATLDYANASSNATKVLLKAVEYDSPIQSDHRIALIKLLARANPSNNATLVLLKMIEHGIEFNLKERLLLAEMSKIANARSNIEKVRKALHERASRSTKSLNKML